MFNQIIKKIKQSGFYDGFIRLVVGGTFWDHRGCLNPRKCTDILGYSCCSVPLCKTFAFPVGSFNSQSLMLRKATWLLGEN